ncbi:MAG: 30S ribosomal protein S12 methylthiotransferase RimO [Lentimicrobiaceae bacterium]|nr:30S ribosomal protein S12 methylthiotransferase RimO [Lentimicrobiaceae bacterium]
MFILQNFVLSTSLAAKVNRIDCEANIITLGCSKNTVDSEQLASQLEQNGFKVTHESDKPLPVTIVNTCGFINDAKTQSIETILHCIEDKSAGKIKVLLVIGCLSQRYKEELQVEFPEVDAFFGVNALQEILMFLHANLYAEFLTKRKISTPTHYAYLKISEGCNQGCAFCAIPKIRGKQVSKPIEMLRDEAVILAENGTKELILIAQDLTHYGYDLYKKQNLCALLEELLKIKGFEWIRLHYAYPNSFQMEILDLMLAYPQLCRYVDIPIQHIDNEILNAMNRRITGGEIRRLIDAVRNKVSDIAIRTSLIVGFPGETKKKFEQLSRFLQETQLDRVGVFTYSHEENTPAYKLKDTVNQKEKERRKEELLLIQQDISLQKNKNKIGQTIKVLIDEEMPDGNFAGRTQHDSPEVDNTVIVSDKDKNITIGEFYQVKITAADCFDLYGVV